MRVVLFCLAMLVASWSTAHATWCGRSDEESWKEFSSLYWASASGGPNRPVIYTIAAPWCPYCAQIFRKLQTRRYSFDVRFIPGHGADERHNAQIADLVLDGTIKSLVRVYVQRAASGTEISGKQRHFIESVQEASDIALQGRFRQGLKTWGSPISFMLANGQIQRIVGEPNLEEIDRRISGTANKDAALTTRRFLVTGVPEARPIIGKPAAKRKNTRAHVLPDRSSLSAVCFAAGRALTTLGVITIDGNNWLVFTVPYKPNMPLHYYGRAEDFDGWRPQ